MVLTMESFSVVTTAKKGSIVFRGPSIKAALTASRTAKHLEPLKGGRIPIEILIRGKDAEQNAKQFEKCLDIIKSAGVSEKALKEEKYWTDVHPEESGNHCQRYINRPFCR